MRHANRQLKKLRDFRFGRINARTEARRQSRIRKSLEKSGYTRINSLFLKFIRTEARNYEIEGAFYKEIASDRLFDELLLVARAHYKRIFTTIYSANEDKYQDNFKSVNAAVFGRNSDIEDLITYFNDSRWINLANASGRMTDVVNDVIIKSRSDGLSLSQISKEINRRAPAIGRKRAATIARTETHNAASYANHQYHSTVEQELGMTMMKRWVATGDARTRSAHSLANGLTVAMDEPFKIGGAEMQYAGDPAGGARNVINCRCVMVYVDAQDVDGVEDNSPIQVAPQEDITVGNVRVSASGIVLNKTTHNDTMKKLVTGVTIAGMKSNLKKEIAKNYKDKKWDDIGHDSARFGATRYNIIDGEIEHSYPQAEGFGKARFTATPAYLARNNANSADAKAVISIVEDTMPELNALAVSFGIPPLRGIANVTRKRALAAMGDGVLDLNVPALAINYARSRNTSQWKQGDSKDLRPWSAGDYASNPTDRIKATLYHEFAHHIHQMHLIKTKKQYNKLTNRFDKEKRQWNQPDLPFAEQELLDRKGTPVKRTNSPSEYGLENEKEWFAENFSAWQRGHNAQLDPDFLPLIELIKKQSK